MQEVLSIRTAAGRNQFRRLYREGVTQSEIAKMFGVTKMTVYGWARDLQLEKRSPGRKRGQGRKRVSSGEKKKERRVEFDSPDAIRSCLNCKRPFCPGHCDKVGNL